MRGCDQRGVVIPPRPGTAFVVVQAELAFELSVVELDLPPQPGEAGEAAGLGRAREVGDPVVGRLGLAFGPFGDQPFLARRDLLGLAPAAAAVVRAPVVRGADAHEHEPGLEVRAVRPVAKRDRFQLLFSQAGDQLTNRLGVAIGPRMVVLASRPGARLGNVNFVSALNTVVSGETDSTY